MIKNKKRIKLNIEKKVKDGLLPISFLDSVIINISDETENHVNSFNKRYEQSFVYRKPSSIVISKIYEIP